MKYRQIQSTDLTVSEIGFGVWSVSMNWWGEVKEEDGINLLQKAADKGITFFDTADTYGAGYGEEIIPKALANKRKDLVIGTKFGYDIEAPREGHKERPQQWDADFIKRACEGSLRRLQTDYIDIYYLHKEDHTTPLAETIGAMADLIRQGKVRYFGLSNYRAWRVAEICHICDGLGIDRPIVSQPYYNAMNRMPEVEHLPACDFFGLGVVPYSPLARGVLTGKYPPGTTPPEDSRAGRNDPRMMQSEWRPESLEIAQTLRLHAEAKGITAGQFALAWVLHNRLIHSAIAGPRTFEQWDENLGTLDYEFTAEDEALVDSLVPIGHPSTPGYNDPAYPVEGRITQP